MREAPSAHDRWSPLERQFRRVRVHLPAEYAGSGDRRCPVLYAHDGEHALADGGDDSLGLDEMLDALAGSGAIEPWIVVAVDGGPTRDESYDPWAGGGAYARFLVEELKPWVDAAFRTRPEPHWTATLGTSLGGLCSLALGLRAPGVFGRIAGQSPTVLWRDQQLEREWTAHPRRWTRVYLDVGEDERLWEGGVEWNYGAGVRAFAQHLTRIGYAPYELRFDAQAGGQHHERHWRARLPAALCWLLGEPP